MKKKIRLFLILIVLGGLAWYLFLKPYDYLVAFKIKTSSGAINQSIKAWSSNLDSSAIIYQKDLKNLTQQIVFNDSVYNYRWEITAENDSISKVRVYVKSINHSLKNRMTIPFGDTDFEKRTRNTLTNFNNKLNIHTKEFKVTIKEEEELPATYCVYIPFKGAQVEKAKGMMLNYSIITQFIIGNNIELNGKPFVEITKWDMNKDSIAYDFCYPILKNDSLPSHKIVKYKQFESRKSLKAVYNGNYITSDRAWYALLDHAERKNIKVDAKPIEVFYNNPNMGGDELNWKAEIFMPLK